jgi:ABC-type sugar transport system, ATPase component
MAEALRLQRTGSSHALILEGVSRSFGALKAIAGIDLTVDAGERRGILGANGAGKTTLFNAITGDFPPTAGRIRFFGEDVTHLPAYERIRRGMRRTYQNSMLFRGLSVLDNLYLAARGVTRGRSVSCARARTTGRCAAPMTSPMRCISIPSASSSSPSSPTASSASSRSAWRWPAHRAASCSTSRPRGLSPAERRELVQIPGCAAALMSFIIIEHDLDVALRVVDRITVMHDGMIFKHGTPAEIQDDPDVQRIYLGGAAMADPTPTLTETAAPAIEIADLHVYYGHAHALQGVSLTLPGGVLGVVGRNGMGKTTLCNAIMGLVPASAGNIRLAGAEILGLPPNEIVNMGVGYVPQGRRVWPSLTVDEHLRLVGKGSKGPWTVERIYQTFPRLADAPAQRRRPALRRRAADAGHQPRPAGQSAPAGDGRADGGAGAGHRRPGRRDADTAGRGRRHLGAAHRAEPRRGDDGREPRRGDGERAHPARDAGP